MRRVVLAAGVVVLVVLLVAASGGWDWLLRYAERAVYAETVKYAG